MLGTIVNVSTIVAGTLLGSLLNHSFPEKYRDSLFCAIGSCALLIGMHSGLSSLPKGGILTIIIISMALGGLTGTYFKLDDHLHKISSHLPLGGSKTAEGLITAIIFFCIGPLSIVGPMQSAIYGDNSLLYTNACLDGITSIALAAAYGPGIIFAALAILLFQGSIYLATLVAQDLLPDYILANITGTGGVLILMSALNLLKLKSIPVTNYLPALIWAGIFAYLYNFIQARI